MPIAIGNPLRNAAEAIAASGEDTRRIDVELVRSAGVGDGPAGVVEVVLGDSGHGRGGHRK